VRRASRQRFPCCMVHACGSVRGGGGGGGAFCGSCNGRGGVPQQVRRDVDRRKQQLRLDIPATNTIALQIPRVPLETPLGIHRRCWRGPRLCAARCIVRCQETIAVRRGGSAWKHSVASRMLRVRALVNVVQTSNVRSAVRNNLRRRLYSQPRRSTPHAPHSTALQWTLRSTHSTPQRTPSTNSTPQRTSSTNSTP
jgi:hypothetical protein